MLQVNAENSTTAPDITPEANTITGFDSIPDTLKTLIGEGNVCEIRILGVDGNDRRTDSGYFDDFNAAMTAVKGYDGRATGCYVVFNEFNPDLLARSVNRIKAWAKHATTDRDIVRRRWLLVDLDSVRPPGISASGDELQAALDKAEVVREWMMEQGMPEPITALSGNGVHLQIPINLPNDEESTELIKSVLATLGSKFTDAAISVDQVVFNAARICRLYGTPARKGDSTDDRPHRVSQLLYVPDYIRAGTGEVCSVDVLQRIAGPVPKYDKPDPKKSTSYAATDQGSSSNGNQSRLMVAEYLQAAGVGFREPSGSGAWTKYVLNECPFDANHKAPDSYVSQHAEGAVTFKCSHDSCTGNKWQQFKAAVGKPQRNHYDPPLPAKVKDKLPPRMQDNVVCDDGPDDQDTRGYDLTNRNDIGNAEHFKVRHGDRLRYCFAWKKWLIWDGTRWKLDNDGTPIRLAKNTVMEIFRDGLNSHDGDIIKLAEESAKASRLTAMISLAAPELPICVDDLDSNGWLLNCPNGTVDLRTGTLHPHERWQNITKLCPTEFEPTAAAPKWGKFLRDIFVDDDLISFVQRLMGYCLTADVSEQKLPIFHGTGANGKSTLLNAFMDVVGNDYTMQAMPDFLMEKRGESHPTEKASLFGKRFVSCVETESSRKLAESTVKMLTGGEKIMARRMREDFWEFNPSHKLVLCTNHKPIVAGQDHGIWRRLLLVPFTQRFEGQRIDKALPEKLRAEAAGVLAWLVRGCMEWQRVGLNPPAIVTNATNSYRTNEDIIGMFINEQCHTGPNLAVAFKSFYTAFAGWCDESGHDCGNKKTIGTWLGENGFERSRSNGVVWNGLMLSNVPEDSFS